MSHSTAASLIGLIIVVLMAAIARLMFIKAAKNGQTRHPDISVIVRENGLGRTALLLCGTALGVCIAFLPEFVSAMTGAVY